MLQLHKLPNHHSSHRVVCIAVHPSVPKIAVARESCVIEVWELADTQDSIQTNATDPRKREKARYRLAHRNAGLRMVTPCGLFWEDLSETSTDNQEVLVVATLSGQFLVYSADELHIQTVSEKPLKGFYAVSAKSIFLEQTMLDGLIGFTSVYAAAMENGFLQVYGGAPHFERFGVGARHAMASSALSVCFSPKGQSIYIGDDRGHIQKFDAQALLTTRIDHAQTCPSNHLGVVMPVRVYYLSSHVGTHKKQAIAVSMCCTIRNPSLVVGTNTGDVFIICLIRNSISARYRVSQTAILGIACASANCIIAGGVDGCLVTLSRHQKGWAIGSRARLHSVTCVSSRIRQNHTDFQEYSTENNANGFMFAAGGVNGKIFCASNFFELEAALTQGAKRNKQFIFNGVPFSFRSNCYSLSALNDMYLLSAIGRAGVFFSKLSGDSLKPELLARISTENYRGKEQFISMTRDSRYLAVASHAELRILQFSWDSGCPCLKPHKFHFDTTEPVFNRIQGLSFGYDLSAKWNLFVASHNAVFSIAMTSGTSSEFRFSINHRISKIIAQQVILCVLCASGEYLIWDESARDVILSTVKCTIEDRKHVFQGHTKPSPLSDPRIADVCFLHTNPWVDYLDRPNSLVFVNSVGEFTIISIETNTLGSTLYTSKEFCQSVYPLPLHHRCFAYSVACLPVQNPSGFTLRDTNILIFSSAHVALFELTRHYENGATVVRYKGFLEACRAAYTKKTRSSDQLAVLLIRNTAAIAPVFNALNELKVLLLRS